MKLHKNGKTLSLERTVHKLRNAVREGRGPRKSEGLYKFGSLLTNDDVFYERRLDDNMASKSRRSNL